MIELRGQLCLDLYQSDDSKNMTDNFEKRTDKHYTYIYKQEFGLRNNSWSITRQEHEPNERPTFESPLRFISFGLSEGSARAEAIELQLKEIKRRKQIAIQSFSVV